MKPATKKYFFTLLIFSLLSHFSYSQEWYFVADGIEANPWNFCTDEEWDDFYFQFNEGDFVTISCMDPNAIYYNLESDFECSNLCIYDYSDMCEENESYYTFRCIGQGGLMALELIDSNENLIFPNDIPTNTVAMSFMNPWADIVENYACIDESECYELTLSFDETDLFVGGWEIPNLGLTTFSDTEFESSYPDLDCEYASCIADAGEDFAVSGLCPFANLNAGNDVGTWSILAGDVLFTDPTDPNTVIEVLESGDNTLLWTIQPEGCEISTDIVTITLYQDFLEDADAGEDILVCASQGYVIMDANDPNFPSIGTWSIIEGGGNIIDPNNPNTVILNPPIGLTVLDWSIVYIDNEFCTIILSDTVEVAVFDCAGCTDPDACNYTFGASEDDGSCEYTSCLPCEADAGIDLEVVAGCPLPTMNSTDESGSWAVLSGNIELENYNDPQAQILSMNVGMHELIWTTNEIDCEIPSDTVMVTYFDFLPPSDEWEDIELCLPLTSYNLDGGGLLSNAIGTWTIVSGTGIISDPNDPYATITDMSEGENCLIWDVVYSFDDGCELYTSHDFCINIFDCIEGCTDLIACNYDSTAMYDDGTCEYESCTDCLGDGNGDNVVNILDLIDVSSNFGCDSDCISGDVNDDGFVNIIDLISVSSNFGMICN